MPSVQPLFRSLRHHHHCHRWRDNSGGECRQQKKQHQQQHQEPSQLSPIFFPSYLRSPLLGDANADAALYNDVLQDEIESSASAAGGVSSTTHPQSNEGNVTDVTCGMRILSPLRFIRRTSPSKQKLQRGKGSTPPLASARAKQAYHPY